MSLDPISDMLSQINNAYLVKKEEAVLPYSKIKEEIIKILVANNYLLSYKKRAKDKIKSDLVIKLKYQNGKPAINKIERISKPGRRLYFRRRKLPYVLSGLGIAIISTPQGLMTAKQARKRNLGGECLCQVY